MRYVVFAICLVLLIFAFDTTDAHGPYNDNVRRARVWLRERTTDRAFHCADILFDRESHWNPRSGDVWGPYGIPQATPGTKMRTAGSDWRWNATTQVKWGRRYVKGRYGSFCRALRFQTAHGWY